MRGNDCREHVLLVLGEAGHLAVRDEIRAVTVVSAVRDREADFVQARRPREHPTRVVVVSVIEIPRLPGLREEVERTPLDARRLLLVDAMALRIGADGPISNVLVVDAAEQIEEDAFTQRAL